MGVDDKGGWATVARGVWAVAGDVSVNHNYLFLTTAAAKMPEIAESMSINE